MPVMMPDHDDLDAIQLPLKKNMIGKFYEVRATQARWIVVSSFWIRSDSVHGHVQFSVKSLH